MALEIYRSVRKEKKEDDLISMNGANDFLDLDEDPDLAWESKQLLKDNPLLYSFDHIGTDKKLQLGVHSVFDSKRPTRTQAVLLSLILSLPHTSLLAQARKSPDKDFAVVAGIVSRVDTTRHHPQVIYVAPTISVAKQMQALVKEMGFYLGITAASFARRLESKDQLRSQVILGTIESLSSLIQMLDTNNIRMIVFDELDYIFLSQGDSQQTESTKFLKNLVDKCQAQILLFYSALGNTFAQMLPKVVDSQAWNKFYGNKQELDFSRVPQRKVVVDRGCKIAVAKNIIVELLDTCPSPRPQVIVFVNKVTDPEPIHISFDEWDVRVPRLATNENKEIALSEFRANEAMILITSEAFPIGYDISVSGLVIFFDPPMKEDGKPDFALYHHLASKATKHPGFSGAVVCLIEDQREMDCMSAIEKNFDVCVSQIERWKPPNEIDLVEAAGIDLVEGSVSDVE